MKYNLVAIILFSFVYTLQAQISHSKYDAFLQSYVNEYGQVNYAGLSKKGLQLKSIIEYYSKVKIETLNKMEQLAYYINVYNLHTIYQIVQHYPIKSIKDIANGKVWDIKNIPISGKLYSLNDIENNIIRKNYLEPRIHFALNCGAKSCPPLLNVSYSGANLESKLAEREKSFLANTSYNQIRKNEISVSKIFEWYGKDFGDLKAYLKRKGFIFDNDAKLVFNEYDWMINGK